MSIACALAIGLAACQVGEQDPVTADVLDLAVREDGSITGRVSVRDQPVVTSFQVVHPTAFGALDFDTATGKFTYRPGANFIGRDSFSFTAYSGSTASAPAVAWLEVTPVNEPPLAQDKVVQLLEDALVIGNVTASDLESVLLTYAVLELPLHGTLVFDGASGAFTYRPDADYNGSDAFKFVANDGELNSVPATVTITVLPVNDPPVAQDAALVLAEDTPTAGRLVASDIDSEALIFAIVQQPAHGTVVLDAATGAFTYRPAKDYNGTESFKFAASDGALSSAPATVSIAITPVNDAPVVQDQAVALDEDTVVTGTVVATDVDSPTLTYAVATQPAHGNVQLNSTTGSFSYRPTKDYNGTDSFRFTASDGELTSVPATVTFTINPVNDPPELPVIPDQTNSPETRDTFVALPLRDVDGDLLRYTVVLANSVVATARVDETASLILTPQARGETAVTVTASDGVYQAVRSFNFTVADVSKLRRYDVADTQVQAIGIANTSADDVTFELRHNGALLATTGDQLVQAVQALTDEVAQEPFERKLWRFISDGSYHFDPMTGATWQHDPLLFLNSIGFGFCDDVMAVYVSLAERAGYTARGWDLTGHAVPEIQVDGRWAMYDPDLAVYYLDADGATASVAQLAADPDLISQPYSPVSSDPFPYGDYATAVYGTPDDNRVMGNGFFVSARDTDPLVLPASSSVTYPGLWAPVPVGVWGTPVSVTAQLRLDLPAGFSGVVDWPLVPWDVQGSGRVRIEGVDYVVGSTELTAVLQAVKGPRDSTRGRPVEVVETSGPLAIVYLLNPMRFSMTPVTDLEVRSLDAWALDVAPVSQEAGSRVGYSSVASVIRPR